MTSEICLIATQYIMSCNNDEQVNQNSIVLKIANKLLQCSTFISDKSCS